MREEEIEQVEQPSAAYLGLDFHFNSSAQASDSSDKVPEPEVGFRIFQYNSTPPRKPRQLWAIVRKNFLGQLSEKKNQFGFLSLAPPIPYTMVIKHGFQLKYTFKSKWPLVWVLHHQRMLVHHESGRVHIDNATENDGKISNSESLENDKESTKRKQKNFWTFACVDKSGFIGVWEIGNNINSSKPRNVFKIQTQLTQMVLMQKFGMYAACSNECWIKVMKREGEKITSAIC